MPTIAVGKDALFKALGQEWVNHPRSQPQAACSDPWQPGIRLRNSTNYALSLVGLTHFENGVRDLMTSRNRA